MEENKQTDIDAIVENPTSFNQLVRDLAKKIKLLQKENQLLAK